MKRKELIEKYGKSGLLIRKTEGLNTTPKIGLANSCFFMEHKKDFWVFVQADGYYPVKRIINFSLGENTQNKSVVKRGLVGAVLFGPVGAVVGGMSGLNPKTTTVYNIDFYDDEDNLVSMMLFSEKKKETVNLKIFDQMKKLYYKPE